MSFTSNETLGIAFLIGILILGIIAFFRKKLATQTDDLLNMYHSDVLSIRIKKYPEVDTLRWYNTSFKFGLVCSLSVAILAFNWTVPEEKIDESLLLICDFDYIIESEIPRTKRILPPPPPPPPPIIEHVVSCEEVDIDFSDLGFLEDLEEDLLGSNTSENTENDVPVVEEEEEEEDFSNIMISVRPVMASFPGCENLPTMNERDACTEKQLLRYMYENVEYPLVAEKTGIEGLVFIEFTVDKNGSVNNVKILRDIGGGCGEEVVRVVKTMNTLPQKWKPAEERGRPVDIRYGLPFRFKLKK